MTKKEYFQYLVLGLSTTLEKTLRNKPYLINAQDEHGRTLLHHAVTISQGFGSSIAEILQVLFNMPTLNFNITDIQGNTALHTAALLSQDKIICTYTFPIILFEASKRGFDFSKPGVNGETVLHMIVRRSYNGIFFKGMSYRGINILHILNNARNPGLNDNSRNPGLNVLSTSGATAFYYAVKDRHLFEAWDLLLAGADPMLHGVQDKNPLTVIDSHIDENQGALAYLGVAILRFNPLLNANKIREYNIQKIKLREELHCLHTLKRKMLEIAAELSAFEVKKNAEILASFKTRKIAFFNKIPPELLRKIAGNTATHGIHTQKQAEAFAAEYFPPRSSSRP